MNARVPFVCGNWKMHKTVEESLALIEALRAAAEVTAGVEIAVAPPFTALHAAHKRLVGGKIRLAAQNVHFEPQGAYTGEVSAAMLRDVGCQYVIVGHSERRQLFGETDAGVGRKASALLAAGLRPIVCVGETLAEREAGTTFAVVERQLRAGLGEVTSEEAHEVVVAYEPVWAIGTGKTATPAQAQEVHAHVRRLLGELLGEAGERMRILYGGSVKKDNARDLFGQVDVDGGLVGGASLDPAQFIPIFQAASG